MSTMRQVDQQTGHAALAVDYILNIKYSDIPQRTVGMAKHCLKDFLSSSIAGTAIPSVESGFGLLRSFGEGEEATVLCQERRVPVIAAVWANSLLGNALDLEDGHYPSLSHPASIVFPVAMALGEKLEVEPQEFIAATVIGYDILGRAGALMSRKYREHAHGFGAPSVYAAAAVTARLLKLDREKTAMALGLAGCHMPAIPLFRCNEHGSMVKGGGPWGAFVGTVAALLAADGFTAPPATLQDPFMADYDESAVPFLRSLGTEFAMDHIYFKLYPACRWAHAPLDAVRAISVEHKFDADQVADILVETFKEGLAMKNQQPDSISGVEFSAPIPIALLIIDGAFGVDQLTPNRIKEPRVLKLASKVRFALAPDLDKMFPKHRPARVTITTTDGKSYTKEIINVHGEPGSEFATKGVIDKFFRTISTKLGQNIASRLNGLIDNLENLASMDEMFELLRTQPMK